MAECDCSISLRSLSQAVVRQASIRRLRSSKVAYGPARNVASRLLPLVDAVNEAPPAPYVASRRSLLNVNSRTSRAIVSMSSRCSSMVGGFRYFLGRNIGAERLLWGFGGIAPSALYFS